LSDRFQRVGRSQDSELFIILSDDSYRGNADLFVDPMRRFDR